MSGRLRSLATGAGVAGLGFAASTLLTLWALPVVVRGLGLDNYAVLVLLVAVQGGLLMVLSSPAQLASLTLLAGLEAAALEQRSRALAAWSLLAAGGTLALGWLLGLPPLAGLLWKDPLLAAQWREAVPWAALGWACQLLAQGLWSAQRARRRPVQAELQQALAGVAFVLAAPLAVRTGLGVQGVVEWQSLVWVLALGLGLAWERLGPEPLALKPLDHRPSFAQIRRLAFWSVLALLGGAVLLYADRLFSLKAGPAELGAWGLASAISLRAAAGLGVLGPLLLPSLSEARHDPAVLGQRQSLYLRCNGLLALSFFVPLAAGGSGLLGAWISPEVGQRAEAWIGLLAFGSLAYALGGAYFTVQMGLDGARPAALHALAAAAGGVLAGAWAQVQGWPGAAWMALAGQGLALGLRAHWLHRHGLGRPGWSWAWQGLPWMGLALGLVQLLRWAGFPRALGPSLGAVLASFALVCAALLALGLGLDAGLARARGRESVAGQLRRLWPGGGA